MLTFELHIFLVLFILLVE